jgi:hypothetical protein
MLHSLFPFGHGNQVLSRLPRRKAADTFILLLLHIMCAHVAGCCPVPNVSDLGLMILTKVGYRQSMIDDGSEKFLFRSGDPINHQFLFLVSFSAILIAGSDGGEITIG